MSEAYFPPASSRLSFFSLEGTTGARHGFDVEQIRGWNERATRQVEVGDSFVNAISLPVYFRELVSEVLDEFGRRFGAAVVGEKWPFYHKHLDLLLEAFPDGRFLYNVRDPRAVWNSGQTFRDRQAGDRILSEMLLADQRVTSRADERFLTFRYEDLITAPEDTMRRVADFLGFTFQPSAIDYNEDRDPLSKRWNWVPPSKGDLDPRLTEKWRTEMSGEQQRAVSERCREFLERYGYPDR